MITRQNNQIITAVRVAFAIILTVTAFTAATLATPFARAGSDETDFGKNAEQARANARTYVGGHDEQELKAQAELPQPSRGLDGAGAPQVAPSKSEPPPD